MHSMNRPIYLWQKACRSACSGIDCTAASAQGQEHAWEPSPATRRKQKHKTQKSTQESQPSFQSALRASSRPTSAKSPHAIAAPPPTGPLSKPIIPVHLVKGSSAPSFPPRASLEGRPKRPAPQRSAKQNPKPPLNAAAPSMSGDCTPPKADPGHGATTQAQPAVALPEQRAPGSPEDSSAELDQPQKQAAAVGIRVQNADVEGNQTIEAAKQGGPEVGQQASSSMPRPQHAQDARLPGGWKKRLLTLTGKSGVTASAATPQPSVATPQLLEHLGVLEQEKRAGGPVTIEVPASGFVVTPRSNATVAQSRAERPDENLARLQALSVNNKPPKAYLSSARALENISVDIPGRVMLRYITLLLIVWDPSNGDSYSKRHSFWHTKPT